MACIARFRLGQFSKCLKIITFDHIVVFSHVQPYDCPMARIKIVPTPVVGKEGRNWGLRRFKQLRS